MNAKKLLIDLHSRIHSFTMKRCCLVGQKLLDKEVYDLLVETQASISLAVDDLNNQQEYVSLSDTLDPLDPYNAIQCGLLATPDSNYHLPDMFTENKLSKWESKLMKLVASNCGVTAIIWLHDGSWLEFNGKWQHYKRPEIPTELLM